MSKGIFYLKKYFIWPMGYGFLAGSFVIFFTLERLQSEPLDIIRTYIFTFVLSMVGGEIIALLMNGGIRLIFGIPIEHRDSFTINSFISKKGLINPGVSDKDLNNLFHELKKAGYGAFIKSNFYVALVVLAVILKMYSVGISASGIVSILVGSAIGALMLGLFSMFSAEYAFRGVLRECRLEMERRNLRPEEEINMPFLKNRFYYFVFLLFLTIGVFLIAASEVSFFLIGVALAGLIMMSVVIKMIFDSVFATFQEIKDFAKRLPDGKNIKYVTGSSYAEVIDLSGDLNKSANELYEANRDLNKFYRLAVGRELRMAELKEEIKKLEKGKKK